jgi:hypothetical protein
MPPMTSNNIDIAKTCEANPLEQPIDKIKDVNLYLQVKVHLRNIPLEASWEENFSCGDTDEGESFSVGVFVVEIGIIPANPREPVPKFIKLILICLYSCILYVIFIFF